MASETAQSAAHGAGSSGERGGGDVGEGRGGDGASPPDEVAAKRALRQRLLTARRELPSQDTRGTGPVLAEFASGLPELAHVTTVAAYVSVGHEPDTRPLLDLWRARGVRVLLPVLLPDNDLDWAPYEGPGSLSPVRAPGRMTLWEPTGTRIGPEGVREAGAVLLPGLAVDRTGRRLGRGGGSYDRVLARLAQPGPQAGPHPHAGPVLVVLLHEHEVLEEVPAEPHDRPVHAAVTPSGVHRFRRV